jgi:hypothetical protein
MSRSYTPARFERTFSAPAAPVCDARSRLFLRRTAELCFGNTVCGDQAASSDLGNMLLAITTESWSGITNENRA